MNLRFINITAKVGDNETMSRKNQRQQTLEAHPHNGDHGKRDDDDGVDNDNDQDDNATWSWGNLKGGGGFGGDGGHSGNGENGDGDKNCCYSFEMGCVIQDNNPRVHYGGPWVLEGNESSTTHNTVVEGSNVSLIFNGKFWYYLREPDTQLTLQVALLLSLAQSLQAISPSRRQLRTSLIHCLPLSRHYPKQPPLFLTSRFILLVICHRMNNTDSSSMSLKSSLRHHMLWPAFPFPPYLVPVAANPIGLLLLLLLVLRLRYLQLL